MNRSGLRIDPLSNTIRDGQYRRRWQVSQPRSYTPSEAKLPPFSGKEEWKVWLNRFEAVAKRRNWDDEVKLDNLLPRLQGREDDFVYNQLSEETLSCYPELIKELNSRFRVVGTEKTFAAKFSQGTQKPNETVEEYAAELKRLYSKAYKFRDTNTRHQDLVRRFLDGLKDDEARFEIDFHKEPVDIDEAVFHAVNFIQSRRRNVTDMSSYQDKKFKKYARRTSQECDIEDSRMEQQEDAESCEYVMRLPSKGDIFHGKKPYRNDQKAEHSSSQTESKTITELKDMVKLLTSKVEELQKSNPQLLTTNRRAILQVVVTELCAMPVVSGDILLETVLVKWEHRTLGVMEVISYTTEEN